MSPTKMLCSVQMHSKLPYSYLTQSLVNSYYSQPSFYDVVDGYIIIQVLTSSAFSYLTELSFSHWPCFWVKAFLNLFHFIRSHATLWNNLCCKDFIIDPIRFLPTSFPLCVRLPKVLSVRSSIITHFCDMAGPIPLPSSVLVYSVPVAPQFEFHSLNRNPVSYFYSQHQDLHSVLGHPNFIFFCLHQRPRLRSVQKTWQTPTLKLSF